MREAVAYIDGGSHGNPGPAGIGAIIVYDDHRVEISEPIGAHDNNYAEYAALLAVLRYAVKNNCTRISIYSDSQVVVRQITGHYSCRSPILRQIHQLCLVLIGSLEAFTITHVRREFNTEADELARMAIHRWRINRRRIDPPPSLPSLAEAFA